MYYIYGLSGPSLLIESTDSMIIVPNKYNVEPDKDKVIISKDPFFAAGHKCYGMLLFNINNNYYCVGTGLANC